MLVLSKLTNINHANGGSYDPPLFLYSALFAARGRFGGLLCTAGFGGASPHGGALAWLPRTAEALAGLPRTAAGFCGASPPGGGVWRVAPHCGGLWLGFPARRWALAGRPARRRALVGCPARRRALAGLPRPAVGFGGASPHSGGLWRGFPAQRRFGGASPPGGGLWRGFPAQRRALAGFPARLSLPPRYIRLGAGSFFAVFRIRARHTAKASAKFRRLHCRISYCIGKFKKFVKINE